MEAVAKHDFAATADDELNFRKNDVLKVLNMDEDKNWYRAEIHGKEGFIPANYIKMKPHGWYVGDVKRRGAEQKLLKRDGSRYIQPEGAFLVRKSESGTSGDYSLSVKFNDSVQHFKVLKDGTGKYFLWIVKFNSINEIIEHHREASVSRTDRIVLVDMVDENAVGAEKVVALYDFDPEEPEELKFRKGDVISVLDKPDPGWWKGELSKTGEAGLFPSTYVRPVRN